MPDSDPTPQPVLPDREDLSVEFKSDSPNRLSDNDMVAAAICLANTDGGDLYLGVEDDGTITGINSEHDDPAGLAALIGNRTVPRLSVVVDRLTVQGRVVLRVRVPRGATATMRADGLYQRRRLAASRVPECVPMQPHEVTQRNQGAGQHDPSEAPLFGATLDDLDPIERSRLRQLLEQQAGADQHLRELSDQELDGALKMTVRHEETLRPTLLGMLLIGRATALSRLVPAHEIAIQVQRDDTVLARNDHLRVPLLAGIAQLLEAFAARQADDELMMHGQRISVPDTDPSAFREAVVNALLHRDYARRGAVRVLWTGRDVEITSPGGLVDGVTVETLLVAPPTPRNFALADALKRLGLAERSARGVDRIFEGQARYGRRLPDYGGTTREFVVVRLERGHADLPFHEALLELERRRGRRLPVPEVIALAALRRTPRLPIRDLAAELQVVEARARLVLDGLMAEGLVVSRGRTRARVFALAPDFLGPAEEPVAILPVPVLSEREERLLALVQQRGQLTRADVMKELDLTLDQARLLLRDTVRRRLLMLRGTGRGARYVPAPKKSAPK